MTRRTLASSRQWMAEGTTLLIGAAATLDERAVKEPCSLPDWTRAHVLAHVAANAEALQNLAHWAATGVVTPMYASPEERAAGIARGVERPFVELITWLGVSARTLNESLAALSEEQWQREVVTAQGRAVSAAEVPWMRSREVFVHAVDLGSGLTFADLPARFLAALCDDVVLKRSAGAGPTIALSAEDTGETWRVSGQGTPIQIAGPLGDVAAYLTGRQHALRFAPPLSPWL